VLKVKCKLEITRERLMDFAETYEEAIDDLLYIINNKEITGEDDTLGSEIATTILDTAGLALGMTGIGEIVAGPMDLISAQLKWNRGEKAEALVSVIAAAPVVGELIRGMFNSFEVLTDMIASNMTVVKAAEDALESPRIVKLVKNLSASIGQFLDSLQDDGYLDSLMTSIHEVIPLNEKQKKFIKNCFHGGLEPLRMKMQKLTGELPNIPKLVKKIKPTKEKENKQIATSTAIARADMI